MHGVKRGEPALPVASHRRHLGRHSASPMLTAGGQTAGGAPEPASSVRSLPSPDYRPGRLAVLQSPLAEPSFARSSTVYVRWRSGS